MPSYPTGTVTFLFSDIEGSTLLADQRGDEWPKLLEAHREILRRAIASGSGSEVGTEGDSFFVAFPTAAGAVAAAVQSQRELAAHEWPGGSPIRVRITPVKRHWRARTTWASTCIGRPGSQRPAMAARSSSAIRRGSSRRERSRRVSSCETLASGA